MKAFRRLVAAALVLALLALPCGAQEIESLEARMGRFMERYGLNDKNFSLCYYDTVTGEEYRFNDTKFMLAASTYKLPLNLYYYELEQSGELSPDSRLGGMRLSDIHYQSLVWSNNPASGILRNHLGTFRNYKTLMRKYFTMPASQIPSDYYYTNSYCTSMMLDTLKYLYERREQFPQMIRLMQQAQPGAYFDRYVSQYEVAHKYGWFTDSGRGVTVVHDTGIVSTPSPFLLVVYTANVPRAEEVLGRACEMLTEYNVQRYEQVEAERRFQERAEAARRTAAQMVIYGALLCDAVV